MVLVVLGIVRCVCVFFVVVSFSQSCGGEPSGVHFVAVRSRLKVGCVLLSAKQSEWLVVSQVHSGGEHM